jgi:hypothetical protein
LRLGYKTKVPLALGIFAAAIALVVAGLLPVQIAFTIAAIAMILTRILPLKELYKALTGR